MSNLSLGPDVPCTIVALVALSTSSATFAEEASDGGDLLLADAETASVEAVEMPNEVDAEPSAEEESIGLSVSVGVASAYDFRGINVFQDSKQLDQNYLVAPSITGVIPGTALSISYWGAYQLTGNNEAELIRAGLGHEQNLTVAYDLDVVEDLLSLSLSLVWYFYPFANAQDAGTGFPQYLEPGISLTYDGPLELTLFVSYMAAIPEALEDIRYTYIRPSVARTFTLRSWLAVSLGLGFGFKIFNRPSRNPDNIYDLQVDWSIDFKPAAGFTISPSIHFAWTNFESLPAEEEYFIWWGLSTNLTI